MFTSYILAILLVMLVASYFTSIMCRLALWRHRRVSWGFAFLGVIAAATISSSFILLDSLDILLQPGDARSYFAFTLLWTLGICLVGSLFALIPAEILVWHYRQRSKEQDHVA